MERRGREWEEYITRMDVERLVKLSKMISMTSEKKMERINPCLKQAELPTKKNNEKKV